MSETKTLSYMIVLRHGEVACIKGLNEQGLDRLGRAQIEMAGQALDRSGFAPDLILSSTTQRTQETTDILQHIFRNAAAVRKLNLFDMRIGNFNMEKFLGSISTGFKTIIISGHAETVEAFADYLLEVQDCEKLFRIMPKNRALRYEQDGKKRMRLHVHKADALILRCDAGSRDTYAGVSWALHGWLSDGMLYKADRIRTQHLARFVGRKMERDAYLPSLRYERR